MSNVLRRQNTNRVDFDPQNTEHVKSLEKFLVTGNWGSVQFFHEEPYNNVPMTVLVKFALAALGNKKAETPAERSTRIRTQSAANKTARADNASGIGDFGGRRENRTTASPLFRA